MKGFILSPEAAGDIREIRNYLAREGGLQVAKHALEKCNAAFQFLSSNPTAGHYRSDLTSESLRFWKVYSYLIIYDPRPNPIQIVRVLHASREIEVIMVDD